MTLEDLREPMKAVIRKSDISEAGMAWAVDEILGLVVGLLRQGPTIEWVYGFGIVADDFYHVQKERDRHDDEHGTIVESKMYALVELGDAGSQGTEDDEWKCGMEHDYGECAYSSSQPVHRPVHQHQWERFTNVPGDTIDWCAGCGAGSQGEPA